ncbi:protein-associating with the carboxyl-terminal domain of ezrin [Colletes gigas]|uniref:protein-associating with the carboxyl-terminal domain of ezrin n=1 Tax=Colletes gigas TaxID=935657 RepID=UPI001C9A4149|nr:protein-associating with the carboxyl-terminal domain of ezrin [Colletes gigas]XP_043254554.1 protein-associating with the carboxyl-terminal domain of ezrin [Colletes gigas]XP_043254556.1 protein-associating with the carboxyl-terminal domain of ezrin [Colletes gigas]
MGNEISALNGLEIDEKSVEVTDFWVHYTACVNGYGAQKVSLFISEPSLHYSANFGNPSPLEKAAKNLMLYRHPCILKYVSSWSKGSKFFLTTEHVKPLIQSIQTQSTLQICMGLYSILRALVFLHEKASASHNNICGSSIYVTSEGCWKLGGLECLCKSKELTSIYLKKIRSYRYERAISADEDATVSSASYSTIDAYAFGILAEDILKLKDSEDVPSLLEFKQFCKENLQNSDPCLRSELSSVLRHPFFTHDFMRIHAFLEELPLKNSLEKEIFFGTLIMQLRKFPESIVAEQLGRLLLSRMVLLDETAQEKLLPFVLKPRDGKDKMDNNLFAISTFKVYLVPKLLQMFCIRDVSIRLVLLSHLNSFVHTFQVDELKSQVLPELLVGIKDTNDHLVSATLKALADIVPILGAATVIGGNRGKLFTDGRPNKVKETGQDNNSTSSFTNIVEFTAPMSDDKKTVQLPERPSPDGGEDRKEIMSSITEEEYTWSDWDTQETTTGDIHLCVSRSPDIICQSNEISTVDSTLTIETDSDKILNIDKAKIIESKLPKKSIILSDISELDIKNSKLTNSAKEEYDFFTDMEPVIKKTQVLHVQQPQILPKSVFDIKVLTELEATEENDGWDDDLSDWGTEDAQELKI